MPRPGARPSRCCVAAGCRRLALATSQAGTPSLAGREKGFRAAARDAGVELAVAEIGHDVVSDRARPRHRTAGAVGPARRGVLHHRPDGLRRPRRGPATGSGSRCRGQLSVIGFDDIEEAQLGQLRADHLRPAGRRDRRCRGRVAVASRRAAVLGVLDLASGADGLARNRKDAAPYRRTHAITVGRMIPAWHRNNGTSGPGRPSGGRGASVLPQLQPVSSVLQNSLLSSPTTSIALESRMV